MLRRDFLKTTSHLAAAAGLLHVPVQATNLGQTPPAAAPSLFRWERIRRDAWVVFNGGGNVLVIGEREGAVVVDCKINGMGQLLRAEIEARVGPVAAIVITHHHGDHSGGYPAFPGTRGIAHAAALPRIRARATELAGVARQKPKELTDDLLGALARDFDVPRGAAAERAIAVDLERIAATDPGASIPGEHVVDRTEVRVGNTALELIHVGPAHTDNDLFVVDRKRGIVHTGDLLFRRYHPFIDVSAGGTIEGWLAALRIVRRACDDETVVVGGHGKTARRSALDEQATYFERLRERVARERTAGRSREEIVKLPNTRFPAYGFPTEWPANLGVAFDELARPAK
jgi:cyclase